MRKRLSISIAPMFWVFAGLLGFLMSRSLPGTIVWIFVILVSVVVHELGHALTAIAFGQNARIRLMFFGGATYREREAISLPKEFLITLNGPVFGFALAGVAYGIQHLWLEPPTLAAYGLQAFVFVNLFWSVVNLFPIMPLDGGHLMRILCEAIFGAKGTAIALIVSVVLGAGVAVASFIFGQFLIGAIFLLLTFESFRAWQMTRHVTEADRSDDLKDRFQRAQEEMMRGDQEGALRDFEAVRTASGRGILYVGATELAAQIYAERGENQKAYDYLTPVKRYLSADSLLLFHRLAYKTGDFETAIRLGKECFQVSPDYHVAYINALAHAAKSDATPAIGWLKCALREGMPNLPEALQGREFDPIRHDATFEEFSQTVKP